MKAIEIHDKKPGENVLSFDLYNVLRTIKHHILVRQWRISGVEATGPSAEEIHSISDRGDCISGDHLIVLAERLIQVIDGTFCGFYQECETPDIVIRAVDSSFFVVESLRPEVLNSIRSNFTEVRDVSG